MGGFWYGANCAKNVGTFYHEKTRARSVLVDTEKRKGKKGEKVFGNRSRRTKRSWSLSSTAGTCALKVYHCVHTAQESHVIGDDTLSVWASKKVMECVLWAMKEAKDK